MNTGESPSQPLSPPMDKKQNQEDDILRRPYYLYDLPPDVLRSLTLKGDAETGAVRPLGSEGAPSPTIAEEKQQALERANAVGAQACSLCGLSFPTVEEQRVHLKSDWHHYNLKLKLRGQKSVSEAEFEKLVGDLDESLSGSDSSSEDDDNGGDSTGGSGRGDSTLVALLRRQATLADKRPNSQATDGYGDDEDDDGPRRKNPRGPGRPPLIWFTSPLLPENTFFGVYRAVFAPEELAPESNVLDAIKRRQLEPISMPKQVGGGGDGGAATAYKGQHMFLCMMGGGHFAAMVVSLAPRKSSRQGGQGPLNREAAVLAHKTFHRYTTRRKQGGSQSANDNAKGTAHSAGSSLRRYNEQALVEDVRSLLRDWKGLLDTSGLLFVRANGAVNRRTLFGPYEGQVLRGNDPRIRGFPFSTRRATQSELMRSFVELTRLKVRELVPIAAPSAATADRQKPSSDPEPTATATKPKLTEEEETAALHTAQTQALVRRSKLPALLSYLKANGLSAAAFRFSPAEANRHAPTLLHLASSLGSAALVAGLLARAGADPGSPNGEGRTPFELAPDRATRDAFRVARAELGEGAWDWDGARVPPALSRAEAEGRDERERRKDAERRRVEEDRVRKEGAASGNGGGGGGGGAGRKKGLLDGAPPVTAQERREEEVRGLTPEQKMRVERERRARAAEERLKRMKQAG